MTNKEVPGFSPIRLRAIITRTSRAFRGVLFLQMKFFSPQINPDFYNFLHMLLEWKMYRERSYHVFKIV